MLNRIRTGYTIQHFRPPRFIKGSVAEWSKALVLGTSQKWRGFESHHCHNDLFDSMLLTLMFLLRFLHSIEKPEKIYKKYYYIFSKYFLSQ